MKPITLVRILLFAAAATPAAALVLGFYRLTYAGDFNALTANPGDYITDQTGTWALGCLAASLSITPIRRLTGWNEIIKARRMLGLFAFFYAVLHMLTWVVFIHYFDVSFMIEDVVKRPFITVGMATFLILLVLAITSNKFSIRKLGRKWGSLHRLAYVAAAGGTLHFWQLVKADTTEPWRWAVGFALLFGLRAWWRYRPRFAVSTPNASASALKDPGALRRDLARARHESSTSGGGQRPTPKHSQLPTANHSQLPTSKNSQG